MIITISPDLEAILQEVARRDGTSPEALALAALRDRFLRRDMSLEPRDEWERRLLAAASDCGVTLSDAALSREEMYE